MDNDVRALREAKGLTQAQPGGRRVGADSPT